MCINVHEEKPAIRSNCKKKMVGTRRLELLTSTVSKFPVAVLTTTYWLLETAEQRGTTRRSVFLQVILQARFRDASHMGFQVLLAGVRSWLRNARGTEEGGGDRCPIAPVSVSSL